jgi:hypothetical protein
VQVRVRGQRLQRHRRAGGGARSAGNGEFSMACSDRMQDGMPRTLAGDPPRTMAKR